MRKPQSKEVTLNGQRLHLHERRAVDVYNFDEWYRKYPEPQNETEQHIFVIEQAARVVFDSLAPNYYNVPVWRVWRRFQIGKAIRLRSIMELPSRTLFGLCSEVTALESGDDVKKKVSQSAENTQRGLSATSGD